MSEMSQESKDLIEFAKSLPSVKKVRYLSAEDQRKLDLTKESPAVRRSIIKAQNTGGL